MNSSSFFYLIYLVQQRLLWLPFNRNKLSSGHCESATHVSCRDRVVLQITVNSARGCNGLKQRTMCRMARCRSHKHTASTTPRIHETYEAILQCPHEGLFLLNGRQSERCCVISHDVRARQFKQFQFSRPMESSPFDYPTIWRTHS